jgi:flagellar biosynthesis protein FliQ
VGVIINIVQVATSMQDSAVSTVPRLAAFLGALLLLLPWKTNRMMTYTASILGDLGRYAR